MEKRKRSYDLKLVRQCIESGSVIISDKNARKPGHALGFSDTEIKETVENLAPSEFQKSMTVYGDSKTWLDVYQTKSKNLFIYLKFKIVNEKKILIISSFKQDDSTKS